jgi:prepilin-type N-terminal cleavage/methylation domain-containing protein
MTSERGYTLVELMVGMVILLMVIAGALSFFIFQSVEGFESFRMKRVDQAVFLTQSLIARDILEAGCGLSVNENLAMLVLDHDGDDTYANTYTAKWNAGSPVQEKTYPDELYVNYSQYLSMDVPAKFKESTQGQDVTDSIKQSSLFYETFDNKSGKKYQGCLQLASASQFQLLCIPKHTGQTMYESIGAVIRDDGTAVDVRIKNMKDYPPTDCSRPEQTQTWTFPLASTVTATVAPAISYKWRKIAVGSRQIGSLWRNRGADADYSDPTYASTRKPILGGESYLDVTDFQVDLRFSDGTWATTFGTRARTDLRSVRITIAYRTRARDDQAAWSPVHQRIFTVSPRNLVPL